MKHCCMHTQATVCVPLECLKSQILLNQQKLEMVQGVPDLSPHEGVGPGGEISEYNLCLCSKATQHNVIVEAIVR